MSKINIREVAMPVNMYSIKCPYSMTPVAITVHNTANDASAENEIRYMQSNYDQTSFHIAVDDKESVIGVPLTRNAWHSGDGRNGKGNRTTIAIEICYSKSGGERFVKAEQNAATLIAQMLKERGWGVSKVTKHQDYSGKYCPHRTLDMGWSRFISMVQAELNALSVSSDSPVSTSSSQSYAFTPYIVRVTADSLNYRTGSGVQHSIVGQIKKGGLYTIVDEENGWGLLKSYASQRNGWINLAYTTRV